jgi:hypothetical protein
MLSQSTEGELKNATDDHRSISWGEKFNACTKVSDKRFGIKVIVMTSRPITNK